MLPTSIPTFSTAVLDVATEFGHRPLAAWVTVTPNHYGGIDVANTNSGETYRIADDDGRISLYRFTGGTAMLLAGELTFTGTFANTFTVGQALAGLL